MAKVLSFRESLPVDDTSVIEARETQQAVLRAIRPELERWSYIRAQSAQDAANYIVRGTIDNPIEGGEA